MSKGSESTEQLKQRSKAVAHRCVKLASALPSSAVGKVVCNQLIRCSTSVAANYRAACLAQSLRSFASKIGIVLEECDETGFWLEFARDESLVPEPLMRELLKEVGELTAIFSASRKTVNRRLER